MTTIAYTAVVTGDCEPYSWSLEYQIDGGSAKAVYGAEWKGAAPTPEKALTAAKEAAREHSRERQHSAAVERTKVLEVEERRHITVQQLNEIPVQDDKPTPKVTKQQPTPAEPWKDIVEHDAMDFMD